jgi:glycosyltransferase involved in cell wall biosynthesis
MRKVQQMISVVCVYNDKRILREYLESSLDAQTSGLEKILIDNSQNKYESAAKALNEGAARANGKYVLFIHQDVRLYPETWLADAEKILDSLQNVGIAGLAGKKDSEGVMSNITHGIPPRPVSESRIDRVETTQTVDECAVIVPKSVFDVLRFDEEVCDNWHLYGVDYSLSVRNLGLEVFVLPLEAYHRSAAYSISGSYYKSLQKVLRKHRKEYEYVHTTMGDWHTAVPVFLSRLLKRTHVLR